ncbi:MAG TPA: DUF4162 domain-containing protein, partial [Firmicutes bacterium]|nr:DUF4162 domain-containing protein [Bacillota bacterium]
FLHPGAESGRPLPAHGRGLFGYLPEERGLYPKMKVNEHLEFLGRINGLAQAAARDKTKYWLARFDLGSVSEKRIEELSKGNQQKVQIIGTLLHEPELLILDEPFAGLDPVNTALLKGVLKEHHEAGKTIIFSSHRMEQVEEICKDIVLIHEGRLVLDGNLRQIKRSLGRRILRLSLEGDQDFWRGISGLRLLEGRADYQEFRLQEGLDPRSVLEAAMAVGEVVRFELVEPSLNQIFVEKVGVGA